MATAPFELKTIEDFAGQRMQQYLSRMDDKMQRGAVRQMASKAGTILVNAIRAELNRANMPYSRTRNAAERKKARQSGQKPLVRTIGKRAWSRRNRGIIGTVVGPMYPAGAHGHLVERGHKITGRSRVKVDTGKVYRNLGLKRRGKVHRIGRMNVRRSGDMTMAHHFQETATKNAARDVFDEMERTLSAFIRKQGTRAL